MQYCFKEPPKIVLSTVLTFNSSQLIMGLKFKKEVKVLYRKQPAPKETQLFSFITDW
jgi:hypothetical protein